MKSRNLYLVVVLPALLFSAVTSTIFAQGSLTPPGAPAPTMKTLDQIESRTPISSIPTTISQSGSYYLTGNLTGVSGQNGITVTTGCVSIDLKGYALVGVTGSKSGILLSGAETNLSISNGTIRNWGEFGIYTPDGGPDNLFENIRVRNNGVTGIVSGDRSIIIACIASSNTQAGIEVGIGGICKDSIAENNGFNGFTLSNYAAISNSSSNGNGWLPGNPGAGFSLRDTTTIRDCRAYINHSHGIMVGSHAVVVNNTCNGNGRDHVSAAAAGIYVIVGGYGNKIEGNHVTGYHGIQTVTGGNLIVGNSGLGSSAYSSISAGNTVGPIVTGNNIGSDSNPHANYQY